jgi:hypothetical protein
MSGGLFATLSASRGVWKAEAKIGLAMPLAYVEHRKARGCLPTPLVMNGMHPNSWELQATLPFSDFSNMQQRQSQAARLESRIRRFYEVSNIEVDWSKTVERYCLPSLFPDCDTHFIKHIVESHQVILKFNNANTMHMRPQAAPNLKNQSKLEVDSHCSFSKLCYELKIDGAPTTSPWTSADLLNGLLAKPFYKKREPLLLNKTGFRTNYKYKLHGVGGSDADASLQLEYSSEKDRAFGENPIKVELSVRLGVDATFLAIRHAEGLLESLLEEDSGISAVYFVVIVVVIFACSFARYVYSHRSDPLNSGYETLIDKAVP